MRKLIRSVVFLTAWLGLRPAFGATGQIVFSANFDNSAEIYTVSPDGSALTQLTDSPGWDGEPVWSPDGTRIAFSSSRSGDRDIFVMNADGSGLFTAVSGPGDQRRPAWSPDGSSLAYVSTERYLGYLGAPANVFITEIGSDQSLALSEDLVGGGRPVWLPDDDRVIFSAVCTECPEYSTNIVSVSTDEANRIELTSSDDYDTDPALSPNGTTVVFVREPAEDLEQGDDNPVAELWSVNSDGTGPQRIRSDLSGGRAPTISPDGRRIVLENSTCGGSPVCLLDSFDGRPATLFDGVPLPRGAALNMDTPDWGCCPGPGRGGVTLPTGSNDALADQSSPALLDPAAGGGAQTASLNAPNVTVAVSELWGGGFQNMITQAGTKLLMAGDNSGVHANTGQWAPSSVGFESFQQSREVASIAVHPSSPNRVWAATTGGVYYSDTGGEEWERKTSTGDGGGSSGSPTRPTFLGNNAGASSNQTPLSQTHPRATGQLLVFNAGSLYAASVDDGLRRSTDDGDSWVQVALDGHFLRSMVKHPESNDNRLYVASLGTETNNNAAGIHEVSCTINGCSATKMSPANLKNPEELVFSPEPQLRLWCACGEDGVWRTAKGDFDSWDDHSEPDNPDADPERPLATGYNWNSIDIGDFDGGVDQEVVAGAVINGSNTGSTAVLQWTSLTTVQWNDVVDDPTMLRNEPVCDTSSPSKVWWAADPNNTPIRNNVLTYAGWDTGFVKFIDGDLYITGRSGAWRMSDVVSGNSLDNDVPCAFVKGLGSTANRAIDAGPQGNNGKHVIVGNTDFDALSSVNGLNAVANFNFNGGVTIHAIDGLTVGHDVDYNFGITTSTPVVEPYALIGAGDRDRARVDQGDVFKAVIENHAATSRLLRERVDWRVVGVGAATQPDMNHTRHEVAVVTGLSLPNGSFSSVPQTDLGLWHRTGTGQWRNRSSAIGTGKADTNFTRVAVEWGRNGSKTGYSKYVFLLDRDSGIWRSDDWGLNWVHIWAPGNPAFYFPNDGSEADFIGFLTINPADQDELVFSSNAGLFEITSARSCNPCTHANVDTSGATGTNGDMSGLKFGPVAFDQNGKLVVVSRVEETGDRAEIWVRNNGSFAEKVVDDSIFSSAAFALTDIAITASKDIYLSSRGQGVIVVGGALD